MHFRLKKIEIKSLSFLFVFGILVLANFDQLLNVDRYVLWFEEAANIAITKKEWGAIIPHLAKYNAFPLIPLVLKGLNSIAEVNYVTLIVLNLFCYAFFLREVIKPYLDSKYFYVSLTLLSLFQLTPYASWIGISGSLYSLKALIIFLLLKEFTSFENTQLKRKGLLIFVGGILSNWTLIFSTVLVLFGAFKKKQLRPLLVVILLVYVLLFVGLNNSFYWQFRWIMRNFDGYQLKVIWHALLWENTIILAIFGSLFLYSFYLLKPYQDKYCKKMEIVLSFYVVFCLIFQQLPYNSFYIILIPYLVFRLTISIYDLFDSKTYILFVTGLFFIQGFYYSPTGNLIFNRLDFAVKDFKRALAQEARSESFLYIELPTAFRELNLVELERKNIYKDVLIYTPKWQKEKHCIHTWSAKQKEALLETVNNADLWIMAHAQVKCEPIDFGLLGHRKIREVGTPPLTYQLWRKDE